MNARMNVAFVSLLITFGLVLAACGGAAAPAAAPAYSNPASGKAAPPAAAPTMAPAPAQAPAAQPGAVSQSGAGDVLPAPYRVNQMIIKNGEMTLLVADTDRAVDQVTGVAADTGGYIISSKSWLQDGFKYASLTLGVPVDQFEVAQRRLRGLAAQVLNDTASGQDVSSEYVDVQSRVANLEATAARIREFLKQAKDVNEALAVNAKLAEVEAEIEQAKGRMQYLKDRSAFSTVSITLEPQRPTPTATPTVTPTATPVAWGPERTWGAATGPLADLMRALVDLTIWVVVLVGPFALPVLAGLLIWRRARRKNRPAPAPDESMPAPAPAKGAPAP